MVSPTMVSIENFPLAEDDSNNISFFDSFNWFVTVHLIRTLLFLLKLIVVFQLVTTGPFSPIKIWIKNTAIVDKYSTKKTVCFFFASESGLSEKSKESFQFWFSSMFKLIFHQNHRFFHFSMVGLEYNLVVVIFPVENLLICILCIRIYTVQKVQICSFCSLRSMFKFVFLIKYMRELLHRWIIAKKFFVEEYWCENLVRFIRILIVRKFQKKLVLMIFLPLQAPLLLSPTTTSLNSSIQFPNESCLVVAFLLTEVLSILFFPLENRQFDILNNDTYDVPSRYWSSEFSVTRGWVSSIVVFAESLKVVEINLQFKSLIFPHTGIFIVQKIQNMLLILNYLGIQNHFVRNYRFYLFHQDHNRNVFLTRVSP